MYEDSHLEMDYEDRFALPDEENDCGPSGFYPEEAEEPCDNSFTPSDNDPTVCSRCGYDKNEHCIDKE